MKPQVILMAVRNFAPAFTFSIDRTVPPGVVADRKVDVDGAGPLVKLRCSDIHTRFLLLVEAIETCPAPLESIHLEAFDPPEAEHAAFCAVQDGERCDCRGWA